VEAWYNLGVTYGAEGAHEKELECYIKAIEIKPDYTLAWLNLGAEFGRREEYDKEIICYEAVLSVDAKDASGWYNMGAAYLNKKEDGKALYFFEEAQRLGLQEAKDETKRLRKKGVNKEEVKIHQRTLKDVR
jgi:tetratricopeptide (TPR) repeat protein